MAREENPTAFQTANRRTAVAGLASKRGKSVEYPAVASGAFRTDTGRHP
jgi:hypothetical protein